MTLGSDDDEVDTRDNVFFSLPSALGQTRGLVKLIAPNVRMSDIPEEIGLLIHLEILDLHSNSINWLPDSLSKLRSLKELNLSHNQLESLPNEIEKLPRLSVLLLAFNSVTWVSEDIGQAQENLKTLDLFYNKLDLEGAFPLQKLALEQLDLGGNSLSLSEIEEKMSIKNYLDLQSNLRESKGHKGRLDPARESLPEKFWASEKSASDAEDISEKEDFSDSFGETRDEEEDWEDGSSVVRNLSSEESDEDWDGRVVPLKLNLFDLDDMGKYYRGEFNFCPSSIHPKSVLNLPSRVLRNGAVLQNLEPRPGFRGKRLLGAPIRMKETSCATLKRNSELFENID